MLKMHQFRKLSAFNADEVWRAVQKKREGTVTVGSGDLKQPEWDVLIDPHHALRSADFHALEAEVPPLFGKWISQVVLLHRLREVHLLRFRFGVISGRAVAVAMSFKMKGYAAALCTCWTWQASFEEI